MSDSLQQNVIDAAINKMEKPTESMHAYTDRQYFDHFLWVFHESQKESWTTIVY